MRRKVKTDNIEHAIKNHADLDDILDMTSDLSFRDYLEELFERSGLTKTELYRNANMSPNTGSRYFHGDRAHPKKDGIISLALAMHCDIDETNRLLKLTDNGLLYPQEGRDAVISYCLVNGMSVVEANLLLDEKGFKTLRHDAKDLK